MKAAYSCHGVPEKGCRKCTHEKHRVDVVVANENVVLEALRTDVTVTSDVREANAENVLLKPHRTTDAIEDIVMLL